MNTGVQRGEFIYRDNDGRKIPNDSWLDMEEEYNDLIYHVNIVIENNEELDGDITSKDIELKRPR